MNDNDYMSLALLEAQKALKQGEVPIGAIIVKNTNIIGRGYNRRETHQQVSHHAEMMAIEEACKNTKSWRLDNCTMYVTLEPCSMCSGAIIQSRMKRVVYGTVDPKNGAHVSKLNLFDITFNHHVIVTPGILREESQRLIKDFFNTLRKRKNDV